MADILGTNDDDIIKGTRGDDLIDGLDGDDRITDVWGDNTINGGGGDDRIIASRGEDIIDGGSGSDRIWARHGDDVVTYTLSENFGESDYYDGGHGTDTLRIVLTAEQAQDPDIQATIDAINAFVAGADPKSSGQPPTTFTFSVGGVDAELTLRNFEQVDVVIEGDLPSLSIDDPTVTEGDPGDVTSITFTVTRTGDNGAESTVAYAAIPGSALFPDDYNDSLDPITGTLTFAAGETTKTITLDITDDEVPEGTETFTVDLSGATNASITKATGTGTILDDDLPSLSIDDPTVTEGDPGGPDATITFTVTRTGDNGAASTVDYAVVPDTAGTPGDYNDSIDSLSGMLSFAAGETTKTITLDITDDEVPEETETFTVDLSGATNASITKATGTGTILDDDLPSLSIDDPIATEGDPGDVTSISFTVTRTGDNGSESTVAYAAIPGSALFPDDYNDSLDPITGTLTFAAGETSKTITLDITDDEVPEGTETFTVELSGAVNATIVKGTGTGTIQDDDLPSLSIDDPTATEGDPGDVTSITFTVTRTGDNGAASTVDYTVIPGSAIFPADYNDSIDPLTGKLSFAAGETTKTITLDITDDEVPEGTETFTVELSGATNASIAKAIGTGTILDNDLPSLSIDDPTVTEGDSGGPDATITFTVTRTGDNGTESTVIYTAVPGSALFPDDYNDSLDPITGTLTFAAGEISKTITLDITDDEVPEGTESFTVELSGATNATIAKGTGTGTINDDDLPSLSIDDPSVTEGDPGGPDATITFTVTRTGDNGTESTVIYTAVPGSALFPDDYNDSLDPITGTLTFAAGETSNAITLDVTDDEVPEGTETFTVELSGATNATIEKSTGTGTIQDDDLPSLSIDDPTATEGDPGDVTSITFTVTRIGDNGAESTVAYAAIPGSATTPEDYGPPEPLSGILTFAPGEMTKTITLDVTDDDIPEATETFTVELSAPTNATIEKGSGTGTINDDDPLPGLSIDNPTVTEGDPGGPDATITFTVTRSGDNSAESTVEYAAMPGSAIFPDDYNDSLDPLTGTLTFAAGEVSKAITLDITDDLVPEGTESFTVTLSNPSNATIVQATGTGTILDNEGLTCGNTWGDPHYVTFDGLKYDYQGVGEYWLVQSAGLGTFDDLNIQTRTVEFRGGTSVNSAIAVEVGSDVLFIDTWPTGTASGIEVKVNCATVPTGTPLTLDGGVFSVSGNQYQVEFANGEKLVVNDFGSHMTVTVCLLDDRKGTDSIAGLLGDFDGDASNVST